MNMTPRRSLKLAIYQGNKRIGYVKSINYNTGSYSVTTTLSNAKNYDYDIAAYDIDYLTKVLCMKYGNVIPYTFMLV